MANQTDLFYKLWSAVHSTLEDGWEPPPPGMTLEDLAVVAWRRDPQTFALRGYPEHANLKLVSSLLAGDRGMVHRGFIQSAGKNDQGQTVYLLGKEPVSIDQRRQDCHMAKRMLDTPAVRKFIRERKTTITTVDAMQFYGLRLPSELKGGDRLNEQVARIARLAPQGRLSDVEVVTIQKVSEWLLGHVRGLNGRKA